LEGGANAALSFSTGATMSDEIGTFYGEPISDMPREKLLEVIKHLSKELQGYTNPETARAIGLGKARMLLEDSGWTMRPVRA
jgi:hypothetical protein